jgi:transposase-like protein
MDKIIDWKEHLNIVNVCDVCGTLGFDSSPKPKGARGDFITVRYECPLCHNTWTAYYGYLFRCGKPAVSEHKKAENDRT